MVLGTVLLIGCPSSGPRLVPVAGNVTVDGAPLASGSLVYKPDASKGNTLPFEPAATIGSDGSYTLYTKEKPGAPVGWYKVSVVAEGPASATDPYAPRKSLIAARYNDPEAAGLSVEVVASPSAGAYDLKLSR